MQVHLVTIVCKFGGDRAICLREEAICAKVYRRTDDGRRAIALAHSWNELNHAMGRSIILVGLYDECFVSEAINSLLFV